MHGDEPEPDLGPEQVIDPDLIGLTHTGQRIPPTVQMKKPPTKVKRRAGKKKSKPSATRALEKDPIIEVEPPEKTANVNRRPKPRPLNPHLINNLVQSSPEDQLSETGEPQPDVPAATHPDKAHPTADHDQLGHAGEFLPAPPQPMSPLIPVQVPDQFTPDIATSTNPNPTVVQPEPDESGRPRRQAPKRKLDPYLTWEMKEASQKAEQDRAKLLRAQKEKGVQGPQKRQRTT